jgi:c-di-GMP-binding flagellar brake protein YcgR
MSILTRFKKMIRADSGSTKPESSTDPDQKTTIIRDPAQVLHFLESAYARNHLIKIYTQDKSRYLVSKIKILNNMRGIFALIDTEDENSFLTQAVVSQNFFLTFGSNGKRFEAHVEKIPMMDIEGVYYHAFKTPQRLLVVQLRKSFRIKVLHQDITVALQGLAYADNDHAQVKSTPFRFEARLVDISTGGMKLACPPDCKVTQNAIIQLCHFSLLKQELLCQAQIMRVNKTESTIWLALAFVQQSAQEQEQMAGLVHKLQKVLHRYH